MKEYQKFYESDDYSPTFANTDTIFEVGDTVEVSGKEYEVESFYKSVHAKRNEVDWLRLRREVEGMTFWKDVYPSEAILISRKVL